jgi:transposase/transcriptional regulator with XRE-family HTH domain
MQHDKKKEADVKKQNVTLACIDDFAIKKRHNYGTVMVDIESHKIIDMIDSREYEDVEKWLKTYPNLTVVSRDGSVTYHNAIEDAHPEAIQVSDRFHLFKNLTEYSKDFLKKELDQKVPISLPICKISACNSDENCVLENKANENRCLSREEKLNKVFELQSAGLKKSQICSELNMDVRYYNKIVKMTDEERNNLFITKTEQKHEDILNQKKKLVQKVQKLKKDGLNKNEISKRTGLNRKTVSKYLKDDFNPLHKSYGKKKSGILTPYIDKINLLIEKSVMGSNIEKIIREDGYSGSSSNIRHYISNMRKRKKDNITSETLETNPVEYIERKDIFKLLYNTIDKVKTITDDQFKRLNSEYPVFAIIYGLVWGFHMVFKEKSIFELDSWIKNAKETGIEEINSFTNGLERDMEAVKNAVLLDYSNGLAEGSINKIKVIKRIMYGRCSFKMLKIKILKLEEMRKAN